jgi:hypothetical protein
MAKAKLVVVASKSHCTVMEIAEGVNDRSYGQRQLCHIALLSLRESNMFCDRSLDSWWLWKVAQKE